MSHDAKLKVLIIGNAGVGKSCLLLRFTDNRFSEHYESTIGTDYRNKTITVNDFSVNLEVWDTAGQERFRGLTQSYYRDAHGIILAYDITDKDSFNSLFNEWIKDIQKYGKIGSNVQSTMILVGCKLDESVNREVDENEARSRANEERMPFFETSAKNGVNVEECFAALTSKILDSLDIKKATKEVKGVVSISGNTRQLELPGNKSKCNC